MLRASVNVGLSSLCLLSGNVHRHMVQRLDIRSARLYLSRCTNILIESLLHDLFRGQVLRRTKTYFLVVVHLNCNVTCDVVTLALNIGHRNRVVLLLGLVLLLRAAFWACPENQN